MVYPEVMADWVKTMHLISGSNRMMEKLNIFGRSSATASQERLASEIETLERQVKDTTAQFPSRTDLCLLDSVARTKQCSEACPTRV